MKKYLTVLIAATLSACSSVPTMYYKDGRQATIIRCEGNSWLGCLKESSNICQDAGYEVIEKSSYRESGLLTNSEKKEMLIICNKKLATSESSKTSSSKDLTK
jgi:hypothetical protein